MFCKNCGAFVPDDGAKFCSKCGVKIIQDQTQGNDYQGRFSQQTNVDMVQSTQPESAGRTWSIGAVLILIIGIICAIGGIITIYTYIYLINSISSYVGDGIMYSVTSNSYLAYNSIIKCYDFGIVCGVVLVAMGIISIMFCKRRGRAANVSVLCSIVIIAIHVAFLVYYNIIFSSLAIGAFSYFLGFILPILLIIVAILNKRSRQN